MKKSLISSRDAVGRKAAPWLFLTTLLLGCWAQAAQPYRPLVFIPGILGTRLVDDDQKVVWGEVSSLRRFSELELPDTGPARTIHTDGLVRTVNVLGPFFSIHQYDGLLDTLRAIGYRAGESLFVFPYDWRQSNLGSAAELQRFVDREPRLQGKQFDILAHSMGGIIAKLYIQEYGGDVRVKRLFTLGTPYRGSMNALAEFAEGWGGFEDFLIGGVPTLRRVLFSFPSGLELFPSYDRCCRIGDEHHPNTSKPFDPLDINVWLLNNWIPPEHRSPAGIAKLQAELSGAQRVRQIMRQPLKGGIEQTMIAGDRFSTRLYLYVDPKDMGLAAWRFSTSVGDGTVPLWSAANSNNPSGSLPAFVTHATIFEDKWVIDLLRRNLDKDSSLPPVASQNVPLTITNQNKTVEIQRVEITADKTVFRAGGTVRIHISLTSLEQVTKGDLSPTLRVSGPSGNVELNLREVTTDLDSRNHVATFEGDLHAPLPGAYACQLQIPGLNSSWVKDLVAMSAN